jgi:hypothetical protein
MVNQTIWTPSSATNAFRFALGIAGWIVREKAPAGRAEDSDMMPREPLPLTAINAEFGRLFLRRRYRQM